MIETLTVELGALPLMIETGKVAKQADGSVTVRYGDTMVLVTAVATDEPPPDRDFFPLTVEYREQLYAAGKIPGGFFKREGRPREKEVVSARLIDRPVRPLFPKSFKCEVQIYAMVLSADGVNDPDVLALVGASTALSLSDIPFLGPVGGVRVGKVDGQLVVNPTFAQVEAGTLDLIVAGTKDHVTMVEAGAKEVSEEEIVEAIAFGHEQIKRLCEAQMELVRRAGKPKREVVEPPKNEALLAAVSELTLESTRQANRLPHKEERQAAMKNIVSKTQDALREKFPEQEKVIKNSVEEIQRNDLRSRILCDGIRADSRGLKDIRPITCEIAVLPRTHGSALFTRGETQSLSATTLGTRSDEQIIEALEGESTKSYMLHYNFPPFSVGEVKPVRGPGRREIGHGALAERAISPVIPVDSIFPYTVRVVSDILESNGSSSMATVCGATLSLMDAGVPIKTPVAGIAMGLVIEGGKHAILSDILGVEDHLGDMDFKVAGSRQGITALQLDIKVSGLTVDLLREALNQAREGRIFILDVMEKTISQPRSELSPYAPRIIQITIPKEKIGAVIGPGGKMIRKITEETGAKIDIEDDGTVVIASVGGEGGEKARDFILHLVEEPEVGKVYKGIVKRLMNFGCFVEFLPGQEGLVHVSQLDVKHVGKVEDVVKEGDEIMVKLVEIDDMGRNNLSRKAVLDGSDGKVTARPPRREVGRGEGRREGGNRDRRPEGHGPRR
jgi:polyribonucleotide nucleotidyltransferase